MANEYDWVYNLVDSSRVSTFLISILLIVYGSFRSLNMDRNGNADEDEDESGESSTPSQSSYTSLDAIQAMCLPIGASISLLVMFCFFDTMQTMFAACTTVIATLALAFLLLPMCQYFLKVCAGHKNSQKYLLSCGPIGRFTLAEIISFALSSSVVCIWIVTGHWLLMDALGMGLCVSFIAFVRLPSLKVSTLLLTGLLLYDVFWVFFSSYIFKSNVMVKVALRSADNPIRTVAKRFNLTNSVMNDAPKLSLPGKLVFPGNKLSGHFSVLGLGDIVMPGLLLCFVMRYDKFKQSQALAEGSISQSNRVRMSYFQCSLIGYVLGLLTATVCSEIFKSAQPALLYLVPSTLLPLIVMAWLKGDLSKMWSGGFDMNQLYIPVATEKIV